EAPGEQVHVAVVVERADDRVEVDRAVKEVPGYVAHERLEKGLDGGHVTSGGPFDVHEVLVAFELESAHSEGPVAELVGLVAERCLLSAHGDLLRTSGRCLPNARWCRGLGWIAVKRQTASQRSCDSNVRPAAAPCDRDRRR